MPFLFIDKLYIMCYIVYNYITGTNLPMLLELFIQRKVKNINSLWNDIQSWGIQDINVYKSEDLGGIAL